MSEYETLARNVIRRTLRIERDENVIVECWNHGLPVAAEFVHQLRAVGARPMLLLEDEDTFWRSAAALPKAKLGRVGTHEWAAMGEADAYIFVPGPSDIAKVREIGMDRYEAATAYNEEWYRKAKKNRLRGARIGLGYVTAARARAYGLDEDAWRRMILDASSVDPRELMRRGRKLQRLLSKRGRVEISARNGTAFSCALLGRRARIEDGTISEEDLAQGENMTNVPAGEAYVAPDERSGEGTIVFDRPVPYVGRWVRGLAMAFDGGRLAKWSASENEDLVRSEWTRAKGDRDRLALIDFGLSPRAGMGFLQDYLAAGNVYVGVGANRDVGGKNRTDFFVGATLTGATVRVGTTTVIRDGRLAV